MSAPKAGSKTVSSAGTAVALVANDTNVRSLIIRAKAANTGNVYIGDSDIDNAGLWLAAGETYNYNPSHHPGGTFKGTNLKEWYIDADTNGEGVIFSYEQL